MDATWDIGQRAGMRYLLIGDADLAGQREWKRHYYTPCGDGKKLRKEALDFCVLHRGDLMRAGLRPEWIS